MHTPLAPIRIPPAWRILPPGLVADPAEPGHAIRLTAGAGFGDGLHPTTQLCLQAVGACAPRDGRAWRLLDFGSGTGILAIGGALLGAEVVGVEIETAAIDTATANGDLNGVSDRIFYSESLDAAPGPFDLVVANILRPVLLAFAEPLAARLAPGGTLILSGLVATDAPEVGVAYSALLAGRRPENFARGDWRALVWR